MRELPGEGVITSVRPAAGSAARDYNGCALEDAARGRVMLSPGRPPAAWRAGVRGRLKEMHEYV